MSSYEDYTRSAGHYDDTRVPVGLEIVLGALAAGGSPPGRQVVLDAGCGTGSYAAALLPHVGRVVGVDRNAGMLERARAKLASAVQAGRAALHAGGIDALPLTDASVDAVMVNQVLHHLGDVEGSGWPRLRAALAEFARVLRPGGVLVVNTCSHAQLGRGWWYAALVPAAVERMRTHIAGLGELESMMAAGGLRPAGRFVPVDALIQGDHYRRADGPLDPAWRAGDSVWAMVEPHELAEALARVERLRAAGALDAFLAEHDRDRPDVGQVTFVRAIRGS